MTNSTSQKFLLHPSQAKPSILHRDSSRNIRHKSILLSMSLNYEHKLAFLFLLASHPSSYMYIYLLTCDVNIYLIRHIISYFIHMLCVFTQPVTVHFILLLNVSFIWKNVENFQLYTIWMSFFSNSNVPSRVFNATLICFAIFTVSSPLVYCTATKTAFHFHGIC